MNSEKIRTSRSEINNAHPGFWRKAKKPLTAAMISLTAISAGLAQQAASQPTFVPFGDFVQSIRGAQAGDVVAGPTAKVTSNAAVEQMRQHLLSLYDGVNVAHSFVLGSQTVDCVPLDQQPSVRAMSKRAVATPPPNSASPSSSEESNSAAVPLNAQIPEGQTSDAFGNSLTCEGSTIPMRRITLEEMARFASLREYFQKGPGGAGHVPIPGRFVPPSADTHRYALAYQFVNNWGDNDDINLWRPYVYTDISEVFSLSQSWTVGTGSTTQTAESGWQNYPARVGTQNSVPFIYFTADDYQTTGCYDLSCPGFVQTNQSLTFGVPWSAQYYSVANGTQNEIDLTWKFYGGNWWLCYDGTWIGYYPGTVYNGGQMTRYSNLLEYGSESVGSTAWPAEGSGLWAANGSQYSSYQRGLWYITPNTTYNTVWESLTAEQPSPACYSTGAPTYSSTWGIYFYYGGPGGSGC